MNREAASNSDRTTPTPHATGELTSAANVAAPREQVSAGQAAFASLAPSLEALRLLAAGSLRRARASATKIASDLVRTPEYANLVDLRDALPNEAIEEPEQITASLEALWSRVSGRNHYEQLLSLFLVNGIVREAIVAYGQAHTPSMDLAEELNWDEWLAQLVQVLLALFQRDKQLDDRLAMWGRRIAADVVLWTREIAGIAPGRSASEVTGVPEADAAADALAAKLFAGHSRRMNALALAA